MNAPHTTPEDSLNGLGPRVEKAIAGDKGRFPLTPRDAGYVNPPTRATIGRIVAGAGVAGEPARIYSARLVRYLLRLDGAPVPPRELKPAELSFVRRRIAELVDEHRAELPAIDDNRLEAERR